MKRLLETANHEHSRCTLIKEHNLTAKQAGKLYTALQRKKQYE